MENEIPYCVGSEWQNSTRIERYRFAYMRRTESPLFSSPTLKGKGISGLIMSKISIITVTRNRPELLSLKAYVSLLNQTDSNFEWIVINDGGERKTKSIVEQAQRKMPVTYREMTNPGMGFALCHGRNLGIKLATNELIAYLDDDNVLLPDFVAQMSNFMSANPQIKLAIPLQKRNRQVWHNGKVVSQGKTFISPQANFSIDDLICHRELFDSNGFVHHCVEAPDWNPNYRIYCDYEYFLQCLSLWGRDSFLTLPQPLVEYIQRNQGIIGQSNYGDWAKELKQILNGQSNYPILSQSSEYLSCLQTLQSKFQLRHQQQLNIPAFEGG